MDTRLDPELEELGIGASKFMCGRKKKYGLNMQACCDADKRFIDFEIKHPATTSDYLAFATSDLNKKLEGESPVHPGQPFLHPLLAIFGDNAYINNEYMVVPFKAVSSGPKDAYNFTSPNCESPLNVLSGCWFTGGEYSERRCHRG